MNKSILFENHNGVGLITLNSPDTMNVFTAEMIEGLGAAYQQCDADDAIKVVVVTGSGKAFCAGADMSNAGATFDQQDGVELGSCPLSMQAWAVRKPVIAACNGHAVGVGMGLAIQADMRIVADEGKYGFVQSRRGVVADFAVHSILPKLVGQERALELILTGRRMTGAEVADLGLALKSVPAAEVLPAALAMASDMVVNCSPLIMGIAKRLVRRADEVSLDDFVKLESKMLGYSMGKPDALEGGMAYFERRPPQWKSSVSKDWPPEL